MNSIKQLDIDQVGASTGAEGAARLPNDQIRIPLTINFPEGQQIGITKPKIPAAWPHLGAAKVF